MQQIWSRTAPSGSTSRCVSCLSTLADRVASRTASEASKRRLRLGNSVTALYTSIFAAAALADARAKGNRRLEWEEKIAAVKEEVSELVNEEQRLLEALESRRKKSQKSQLRGTLQTGTFRTHPRPTTKNIQLPRTKTPFRSSHSMSNATRVDEQLEGAIVKDLELENKALADGSDDFDMAIDCEEIPKWLATDLVRGKVIRKLALKQLAIRLLLRPAIAHSYMGVLKNYDETDSYPKLNLADLLHELDEVRRRLRNIKTSEDAFIDDIAKDFRVRRLKDIVHGSIHIDKRVRHDINLYLHNQMPLEELLLRLSNTLLQAQDPDRTYVMKMMILAFTKTRQNDLAELVVKTVLPYKFPLSSSLIVSIITFFRKSKDLKSFDLFLKMLRGEGYPVDMGNLGFFKKKVINGVEVTLPPVHSANIVVYAALIKACLRFDQPERADAYLLAARAAGCMDDFAILMAYLEFCAIRRDWEKGLPVLKRTLAFITATTEHPLERVERLIVMMVHLCDSCQKPEVSDSIIGAAVNSGFDWTAPQRQVDIPFENDPDFQRWHMAEEASTNGDREIPMGEKCYTFVNSISKQLDDLTIPEEQTSARQLHKLMATYSHEVLSSVLYTNSAQYKPKEGSESGKSNQERQPKANAPSETDPAISHAVIVATQQQEIGALKNEVAQLKQMVFNLIQSTAVPNTPNPHQSAPNELSNLKKRLVPTPPALNEVPSRRSKHALKP